MGKLEVFFAKKDSVHACLEKAATKRVKTQLKIASDFLILLLGGRQKHRY